MHNLVHNHTMAIIGPEKTIIGPEKAIIGPEKAFRDRRKGLSTSRTYMDWCVRFKVHGIISFVFRDYPSRYENV